VIFLKKNKLDYKLIDYEIGVQKSEGSYYFIYRPVLADGVARRDLYRVSREKGAQRLIPKFDFVEAFVDLVPKNNKLYLVTNYNNGIAIEERFYEVKGDQFISFKKQRKQNVSQKKLPFETYNGFYQLRPSFLLSEITTDTNEYRLSLTTRLNDPMNQHSLFGNLSLLDIDPTNDLNNSSVSYRYRTVFEENKEQRLIHDLSISNNRYSYLQLFDETYVKSQLSSVAIR
jgi:hypothetical protein